MRKIVIKATVQSFSGSGYGQDFLGEREASWPHIFVPAMNGMQGRMESFSRVCFIDGKCPPLEQVNLEAEHTALL